MYKKYKGNPEKIFIRSKKAELQRRIILKLTKHKSSK